KPDDSSDRDPHPADARFSAHYGGVAGDARQLRQVSTFLVVDVLLSLNPARGTNRQDSLPPFSLVDLSAVKKGREQSPGTGRTQTSGLAELASRGPMPPRSRGTIRSSCSPMR